MRHLGSFTQSVYTPVLHTGVFLILGLQTGVCATDRENPTADRYLTIRNSKEIEQSKLFIRLYSTSAAWVGLKVLMGSSYAGGKPPRGSPLA
jgi:hypothetical protein